MRQGYRQVDHTADIALALWAPTEEDLLAEGARGVIDLLTEGASFLPQKIRRVSLQTLDAEDRLVQVLNEVLVLAVVDGFLTASLSLTLLPNGVEMTLHGEDDAADRIHTELKAVTYHGLQLSHDAQAGLPSWSLMFRSPSAAGATHRDPMKLKFEQLDAYRWRIPREGKMNAPATVYASEEMIADIEADQSLEQIANVAHLPGIQSHAIAMPDMHWGYGFPIGGVAASTKTPVSCRLVA